MSRWESTAGLDAEMVQLGGRERLPNARECPCRGRPPSPLPASNAMPNVRRTVTAMLMYRNAGRLPCIAFLPPAPPGAVSRPRYSAASTSASCRRPVSKVRPSTWVGSLEPARRK